MDSKRILAGYERTRTSLLAARTEDHHWVGELSSSPLSTATAVTALSIVDQVLCPNEPRYKELVKRGLDWIVAHANADGGWGDTDLSHSNISTTVLCWSALHFARGEDGGYEDAVGKAEEWLEREVGGTDPKTIVEAVTARYGKDKTFSVPILTMAALAGRLGAGRQAWAWVKPLPFELAALPPKWYAALQLPVVSYALPALIAIGIARHAHLPSRSPIWRAVRASVKARCLSILFAIQPKNGGFLEATPLTSFVAMSLASSRLAAHPVTLKAVDFIVQSVREDGSWPIDTNLSTWVTTQAVAALGEPGVEAMPDVEKTSLLLWLRDQQHLRRHPYTQAEPGGWSWTDLPGGVPDADDTAGGLIASHYFWSDTDGDLRVAKAASNWLCRLQNQDGGIPTFCKGWGTLPFDRSSPDITAHAIRAWVKWLPRLMPNDQHRAKRALSRAVGFLLKAQRGDGTWCPLWFGNQDADHEENPTYGTARVVQALADRLPEKEARRVRVALVQAMHWFILNQNDDGGWGGGFGTTSSVEETSLAVEAILSCKAIELTDASLDERWLEAAAKRGVEWLLKRVEREEPLPHSPIGFYFAKLWYYEKLYPMIFAHSALRKAREMYPVEEAVPPPLVDVSAAV